MGGFGHLATSDHIEPPIHMDGVEYSQVAFTCPFIAVPPSAEEWRLYVIRGEGVWFDAPDFPNGGGFLAKDSVIGIAGNAPHRFLSFGQNQTALPPADWNEQPLSPDISADAVVIGIGRIPQCSLPFVSLMGGFIHIDPDGYGDVTQRICKLMGWIAEETGRNDPVSVNIILRLAEIITIEIGRVGRIQSILFNRRPQDARYDVRIWRTITAISEEPQRHWTVGSMAHVAGMSRSAFAARYHEAVGQTPMRSLRRLRMHRAAMTLASTELQSIAPLADEMGYGSDAAFNRAFNKEFGLPPKRYGENAAVMLAEHHHQLWRSNR